MVTSKDDAAVDAALLLRHEVRRPLTYLVSCLDWVRRELERHRQDRSFDPVRSWIAQACASAEHIAEVVADEQPLDGAARSSCELSSLLRATLRIVGGELQTRARLALSLDPAVVRLDEARARRLLLNLVVNALVMLPEAAAPHKVTLALAAVGGYAVLELRHGGTLPFEAQLALVSAPYFPTLDDGSGLNLGWAICKRIVHGCGGSLVIERDGGGTRVRVVLPLAETRP